MKMPGALSDGMDKVSSGLAAGDNAVRDLFLKLYKT